MVISILKRFSRSNKKDKPNDDNIDAATKKEEGEYEWDRPIEFVFSLISNSVGLGNVWRFPYIAAKNGGGAFLIPYFTLYFLVGAPLYYLELALGQFSSRGPATSFILAKGWQGIGWAMIINSVLTMFFYNVVVSWSIFYLIASLRSPLLWSECGHWWNTEKCFVPGKEDSIHTVDGITWNCTEAQYNNLSEYDCVQINKPDRVAATEEFFYKLLLKRSDTMEEFGTPGTYGAVSLLVAWIVVCLCTIRGVKSSGKIAYVTAIFPYIVLLILIIFTATLDGSKEGVIYYVVPRWHLVGKFETWQAAAGQVFFSLSVGFGALLAYASSNKFNNNFYRQMCIVVACDCFTGVFAGFAVFATVGFLAKALKESVDDYAQRSGPGLAFIVYPEAVANMPASPFFSIIFFAMLLALGFGSQFALTNVPICALIELFPVLRSKRAIVVISVCVVSFLISLPFTCPGGFYLLQIVQQYAADIAILVIALVEVIVICYIYGFNRIMNDIRMMLGKRAGEYYLFITWCIAIPIILFVIIISNFLNVSSTRVDSAGSGYPAYTYPRWTTAFGWILFAIGVIPIPLYFIFNYLREYRRCRKHRQGTIQTNNPNDTKPYYLEALTRNNTPSITWGPKRSADQTGKYEHLRNSIDYSDTRLPAYTPAANEQDTEMNDIFSQRF